MRIIATTAFVALTLGAGCTRHLTDNEARFAHDLFGDTIETDSIEVLAGAGLTPLPYETPQQKSARAEAAKAPPRKAPEDICVRKPSPRKYAWSWPAAFVLENNVYLAYRFYAKDAFAGVYEGSVPYPLAQLMAHELVHVWQWQNRDITDYTPEKSGSESVKSRDPYYWVGKEGREFLSYGYEQQAAIIEDFVCYALLDPQDAKLDEIASILRPVLPVDRFLNALGGR
ncbi:MAG: hypothetical protein ACRBCL_04320 [Maritimibacter sp.]